MTDEAVMPDFSKKEREVLAAAGISPESVNMAYETPNNTEEALARILEKLTFDDEKYINLLSDLNEREVALESILYARACAFEDQQLKDFLLHNKRVRVSKKRMGRAEIIKLSSAMREAEMKRNMWSRMKMMAGGGQGGVT